MLLDFIPIIGKLFDRIFPDPAVAADAKLKLFELTQQGELADLDAQVKLAAGQTDINKVEAASTSLFVAGWRPFIGWVCGSAFAYKFVFAPFIALLIDAFGGAVALPDLSLTDLLPVLLGLLGLGGLRTLEKIKGVA